MTSPAPHTISKKAAVFAGFSVEDLIIFGVVSVAFLTVIWVANSFVQRDKIGPRARALKERREMMQRGLSSTKRRKKSVEQKKRSVNSMRRVVEYFQLMKKNDQMQSLEQRLMEAGWRSRDAVVVYMFFRLILPLLLTAAGVALVGANFDGENILAPLLGLAAGYYLPDILISNQKQKRHHKIRQALPDTLDLMTICAEAGLSLAATLDRVARELQMTYPDMAEEVGITSIELNFLPERAQALSNFADRVKIEEVRGITNVLLQTEKYGTPVSQALRVLSAEFREQRMLRAEQKAARLPAIMTIPMIVMILPTMFIIVMTPAVLSMMGAMK